MARKKLVEFCGGFNLHLGEEISYKLYNEHARVQAGDGGTWARSRSIPCRPDVETWMSENLEGDWSNIFWHIFEWDDPIDYYIRFSNESDMTLFKMRWL